MRLHCEIRSEAPFPPRSGFVQHNVLNTPRDPAKPSTPVRFRTRLQINRLTSRSFLSTDAKPQSVVLCHPTSAPDHRVSGSFVRGSSAVGLGPAKFRCESEPPAGAVLRVRLHFVRCPRTPAGGASLRSACCAPSTVQVSRLAHVTQRRAPGACRTWDHSAATVGERSIFRRFLLTYSRYARRSHQHLSSLSCRFAIDHPSPTGS
jgi:hypothetical protein